MKKYTLVIVIALAAVLLLVSCQRSASQAPLVITPSVTSATGVIALPTNGMSVMQMVGTQTALAQTQQVAATSTPNPSTLIATSTPLGTPASFTLIPPTGAASTPIVLSTTVPGTTPIVIVATTTPGHPANYTLMDGEFPYCIARRFNVNQAELLAINGLSANGGPLQPGMVLTIPQTGNPFVGERALHPHPGTFVVDQTNDNIYKVACYYGDVDPTQIIAANSLVSPYLLHIGQVLNIP